IFIHSTIDREVRIRKRRKVILETHGKVDQLTKVLQSPNSEYWSLLATSSYRENTLTLNNTIYKNNNNNNYTRN
ncbi:hypothetical protein DOY81_000540, partial [Sarcophaga bullata]